jgi:hypothetical protein
MLGNPRSVRLFAGFSYAARRARPELTPDSQKRHRTRARADRSVLLGGSPAQGLRIGISRSRNSSASRGRGARERVGPRLAGRGDELAYGQDVRFDRRHNDAHGIVIRSYVHLVALASSDVIAHHRDERVLPELFDERFVR